MEKALFIGRFQPFHLGHLNCIEQIEKNPQVSEIIIGIGSSQYHNYQLNPFSFEERREMIEQSLDKITKPYQIIAIPDLHNGTKWVAHLKKIDPDFTLVYISNLLTANLLEREGIKTASLKIALAVRATDIRQRMIQGESWQDLVPDGTKQILDRIGAQTRLSSIYLRHINPTVTADIIIPYGDNKHLVLIKRAHEPFASRWALPGGYYETGRETTKQTALREALEETGIVLPEQYVKLLGVYDQPDRDPRSTTITIAYYLSHPYSGRLAAGDDAADIAIFNINDLPTLAFDHQEIVNDYLKLLML